MSMININSNEEFKVILENNSKVSLIYFHAEWCGPSIEMLSFVEGIANDVTSDTMKFYLIDVDHNKETPAALNVKGLPTLMMFTNGRLINTKIGAMSKSSLEAFINSYL